MAFVHLHNHSEYSMLDGITHIYDMVKRAAEFNMPAVALTDHGVMSGCIELCDACARVEQETGKKVKPIYGCECYMVADDEVKFNKSQKRYHLILLAKTTAGYHNMVKLVSESHVDNFYSKPLITMAQLRKYGSGIIGSSACIAGIIPQHLDAGDFDGAVFWAKKLAECFDEGDFYIELQDAGYTTNSGKTQNWLNHELDTVAKECCFKTIATNDFHFLNREDAVAQDIMICIGTGKTVNDEGRMKYSPESYMKSEAEMREALREFPEACDNTVEVANKCHVEIERESILPIFPVPDGFDTESYFRHQIETGLVRRYGKEVPKEVWDRYEYEAGVIIQQGFPAYFLIVQEYIQWARDHGIGVGPGRGSAAGSLVSYALGITDLDPLANGLLFERFLSPERVEMPDIDVDFDDDRRDEVIEHIKQVYGEDHVSGVITYGKLKARNAIRDACRVLDYPIFVGDRISKMIPDEIGISLNDSLKQNHDLAELYKSDEQSRRTIDAAKMIEGQIRGEGVHACATIICRDPMSDHVPMKRDTKGGMIITQYDGHYTPELGLLKMDFLGLRTLGVLSRACKNVYERTGTLINPEEIPIDDEESFEFMRNSCMDGLFQVESALYVKLFHRLPPRKFSDIVASIALNRPGPLESGMVDDYIAVASGKVKPHYYDDRLRPILEETYGTMVYQEQIMQVSMAMCGFSAGKADKLRKAMGKKKLDVMKELQEDWDNGAVENGFSLEIAKQIWNDAEKFAKYAFNKSHSAAYAVLVMRTAYMKSHYPNDYMAAVLSSYMGKTDKLIKYISSCNRNGTPVLPPDINSSNVEFTPVEDGIRFGLNGVKGVGEAIAEAIIAERNKGGNYTSMHDLLSRVDAKLWNKKSIEALIKSGAFDSTGYTRKQLNDIIYNTPILEDETKRQKSKAAGQSSIFELASMEVETPIHVPERKGSEWERKIKNKFEKEFLGLYVSDHPLADQDESISKVTDLKIGNLTEAKKGIKNATLVGLISEVKVRTFTRRGQDKRMCNFVLEDTTGSVDCVCFDFDKFQRYITDDAIVIAKGKFEKSLFEKAGASSDQVIVNEVLPFESVDSRLGPQSGVAGETNRSDEEDNYPEVPFEPYVIVSGHKKAPATKKNIDLKLSESEFSRSTCDSLCRIMQAHPGSGTIRILLRTNSGKELVSELPIRTDLNQSFLNQLNDLFGRTVA